MRDWISRSFREKLLYSHWSSRSLVGTVEIEVSSFVIFCKYNTKCTYGCSHLIISRKKIHGSFVGWVLQMWNNIISIHFKDEDCTKQWRQTFTMDFEGKYKKVCGTPFADPCKSFFCLNHKISNIFYLSVWF